MSKIVLAVLTAAAFLYAAWLVLFRRQLPDPKQTTGVKRRFILATLLFVGLFGIMPASAAKKKPPRPLCYRAVNIRVDQPGTRQQFAVTLKAVWRTLDPARAQEFREKLDKAAGEKVIRKKTADMLAVAFAEVAYHKERTHGKIAVLCYSPAMTTVYFSRENVQKQLDLLQKARKAGKVDEQTSNKALAAIAREVEMLYRSRGLKQPIDQIEQNQLNSEYSLNKLFAGDSATIAAKIIVEMEDGRISDLTPAKRLAAMKDNVEKLLTGGKKSYGRGGPAGNDWMDPGIHPNVYSLLEKAGIIPLSPMVDCYTRMAAPVKARSEELKKLQQQLLDKNVKAGVLDAEIAEKAVSAVDDKNLDFATEKDISDYQKKVRRVMRLLYKHGELPSSFVEKIERAADVEIIAFDKSKVLRNDVRWHFRSLFWESVGDEMIEILEKRNVIPKALTHRMMMDWTWYNKQKEQVDKNNKQLAGFIKLLNSKEPLTLKDDANNIIKKYQLPQTDTKYCLEVRRICRILIKTGLVTKDRLKPLEEAIGIPIISTIEK